MPELSLVHFNVRRKQVIDAWRADYNESRPHRALRNQTAQEFALAASTWTRGKGDEKPQTLSQTGPTSVTLTLVADSTSDPYYFRGARHAERKMLIERDNKVPIMR